MNNRRGFLLQYALREPQHHYGTMTIDSHWQLAIFDCDGVLVDSESITHRVLADALGELGLRVELDEAFALFMGNTLAETIAIIESRLGKPLPQGFFPAWRERLYETLRAVPVRSVPGVVEVLDELTVPACVVSNGPLPKMLTTLGVTGLLGRFEGKLFSAESGLPGKPHPDMFLAAAERFGAEPARTFVVEDSPKGVRGGIAAGMTVFGYAGGDYADAEALHAAGARVFTEMRELPKLLEEHARRA